jgi:Uma2 family endonuclease
MDRTDISYKISELGAEIMITLEQEETQNEDVLPPYEAPLPPQELIFDDGEPLETARHRNSMNILIDSLRNGWKNRSDFYVGGNMFIYYTSAQLTSKPQFRGPDFFLVLDTDGSTERKGWVVWEESGKYPDMIVEFLSLRTRKTDVGPKKDIYEKIFHTREYYVYDPFDPTIFKGWRLNRFQFYEEILKEQNGRIFSETTDFYLGPWEGYYYDNAPWLRFFDKDGNLVLTHTEEAQKIAEEEKKKAEEERMKAEATLKKLQDAEKKILQLEEELKKHKII